MDAYQRRNEIVMLVNERGRVTVKELSDMFDVSEVTVRIDLTELEANGLLSRTHGGAVRYSRAYYKMSLCERMSSEYENKQKIAKQAASMIKDGDTVMLNSGTTTLLVLRAIAPNIKLSIVTNSVDIALEAGTNPNYNVVLLGGSINSRYHFSYGIDANLQLAKYHADKLFLSVDGIDCENGFTTYYDLETDIDKLMLKNSATKILVADSSKIGRTAFAGIAALDEADYIVTNQDIYAENDITELKKTVKNVITI